MTILRAACEWLLLALGAVLLLIIFGTWGAISTVLYPVLPASVGRRIGRLGAMWWFRIYLGLMEALGAWHLDLSALDELRDAGPLIIAPNHPCLLDALLVISRLPNALCVMKRTLAGNFLLGPAARLARYVPNDSLRRLLTRAGEELHRGGQLLIFPEGTRTSGGCIGPLTDAVGALSRYSGVPVQVVLIETRSPFLGKGRSVFARPSLPLTYRVRLGRRFEPPKDVRAFTAELERQFVRELASRAAARAPSRPAVGEEASRLRG